MRAADAAVGEELRSRALHYGDGVFRTLLVDRGEAVDAGGQIERLRHDCILMGLRAPSRSRVLSVLAAAAAGRRRGVVKVLAWRQGRARGYAPRSAACTLRALYYALPSYPHGNWSRGIRVARSPVILSEQPLVAGVKHLNRLDNVLASRDWPKGVSELLTCDRGGHPVAGTRSNLFWVREGALCTPALRSCGVAGRTRERVLALAPSLGLRISIRRFRWESLASAEEIFVTNSVIGVWSVLDLDEGKRYPRGDVGRGMLEALEHPFRGRGR